MYITRIERLAQKKNRIYIDGDFAFMLYDRDIGIYSLGEGQDISDLLYNTIINDTVLRRAKQKALAILERSDRTEAEIRRKLAEGMYSEDIIDRVVQYLTGLHYLDDRRYAESFIRSRADSASSRELTNKLFQKGISKDIIAEAVEAIEEECAFGRSEQEEDGLTREQNAAVIALRKKLHGKNVIDYSERQKLIGFMLRKGYRMPDINTAFDFLSVEFEPSDGSNSKTTFFDFSDNF